MLNIKTIQKIRVVNAVQQNLPQDDFGVWWWLPVVPVSRCPRPFFRLFFICIEIFILWFINISSLKKSFIKLQSVFLLSKKKKFDWKWICIKIANRSCQNLSYWFLLQTDYSKRSLVISSWSKIHQELFTSNSNFFNIKNAKSYYLKFKNQEKEKYKRIIFK